MRGLLAQDDELELEQLQGLLGLPVAAAPIARRGFAVLPEPRIPPGATVVQRQPDPVLFPLDEVDADMPRLRGQAPQTRSQVARDLRVAGDLAGASGGILAGVRGVGGAGGEAAARWSALRRAEQATVPERTSSAETWRSTGWQRFPDGRWRWEIPDTEMRLQPHAEDATLSSYAAEIRDQPMRSVVRHDRLFDAYPELGGIPTSILREGSDRYLLENPSVGGYWRPNSTLPGGGSIVLRQGVGPTESLSMMRHELQHAVQAYERHSPGVNPNAAEVTRRRDLVVDAANEELQRLQGVRRALVDAETNRLMRERGLGHWEARDEAMQAWRARYPSEASRMGYLADVVAGEKRPTRGFLYLGAHGETEARAAQARGRFSPERLVEEDPLHTMTMGEARPPGGRMQLWDPRDPDAAMTGPFGLLRRGAGIPVP